MKSKLKSLWLKAKSYMGNKLGDILKSNAGWFKTTLMLAALVAIGLIFTAIVVGFVLLLVFSPGLLIGTIVWFPWTYLQLGATYFPDLDPRWLNIQWFHFVVITAALAWLGKLFRFKRSRGVPGEISAHDGSWKLKK